MIVLSQFLRESQSSPKWIPLNNNTFDIYKNYVSQLTSTDLKKFDELKKNSLGKKLSGEYSFDLPNGKHITFQFLPDQGLKGFKLGEGKAPAPQVNAPKAVPANPNPSIPPEPPSVPLSDKSKPATPATPQAPVSAPAKPVMPPIPAPNIQLEKPKPKQKAPKPAKPQGKPGWVSVYDKGADKQYKENIMKLSPEQRAKLKHFLDNKTPNAHEVMDFHDGSGVFEFSTDKNGDLDSFTTTNKQPVKDHPAPIKQEYSDTLHVPFSIPPEMQPKTPTNYDNMTLHSETPVEHEQPVDAIPYEEEPLDAQPLYDVPFQSPNHQYTNVNNYGPEKPQPNYNNPKLDKQMQPQAPKSQDRGLAENYIKQKFNHSMSNLTQHYLQINRLNSAMQNFAQQLTSGNNFTESYNLANLVNAYEAMVSDVFKISSKFMEYANQARPKLELLKRAENPSLDRIKQISESTLQYLNQMISDLKEIQDESKHLSMILQDQQLGLLSALAGSSISMLQGHMSKLQQIISDPKTWQDQSIVEKGKNWLGNQWTNLKNKFTNQERG